MGAFDRITNIPPNITDHILQCLPLRDAVRTSILSTHWRYKWVLLPQLILDPCFIWSIRILKEYNDEFYDNIKSSGNEDFGLLDVGLLDNATVEYSNIVNTILLCHDGPIHKFVLYIPWWFKEEADFTCWIHFVSRMLIKEFEVCIGSQYWRLPSCMFSSVEFNHVTHLTLVNWVLPSVSRTFRGFPSLIINLKLYLNDESSAGQAKKVGTIISKCPLLENLNLKIFDHASCLTIHAPKLQNLVVKGRLPGIFLEETDRIKMVSLDVGLDRERDLMIEFFSYLPVVEKLILGYRLWNICFEEKFNISIPNKFRELKNLLIEGMDLARQCDVFYLSCFLNMAPKLQILEIEVADRGSEFDPSVITAVGDCCLDHLKSAKIKHAGYSSYDIFALPLIKMVLSSSPVLEVVTIKASIYDSEKFKVAQELLQYRRASTNVEIIFNQKKLH